MTATHHFHVRSDHAELARRPVPFIAAGIAATVCTVIAISSIGSSGETPAVGLDARPGAVNVSNPIEPVSALLDGRAFSAAVQAGIAGVTSHSVLLDGAAFELAVTEAVAFGANGSALVHGTGFVDAVASAVTAATD